jgi:DNA primase large subunit
MTTTSQLLSLLTTPMQMTARALPRLDEDDRIVPLLQHLSLGFIAGVSNDTSRSAIQGVDGGKLTADMIDALVRQHAPMCMRNLHESLHSNGHLRHYGRLQYNLFLKDIGLPLEEALLFWRRSFRGMSDDKFNKEYKYNIRYGYGLEGKRINYPAKRWVSSIEE